MVVVIEGIEKLEKECLICIGLWSGLQGGSLDNILDIKLSKNWSNTLGRSSISGNARGDIVEFKYCFAIIKV